MRFLVLAVIQLLLCACATNARDLGHGYSVKTKSYPVLGGFESLIHKKYIYHDGDEISTVGQYYISPSGRFLIYEAVGKLMLFDAITRDITDITEGQFALPRDVNWSEKKRFATVNYYDGESGLHPPSRIALPE